MHVSITDLTLTRDGRTVLQIPALTFPGGSTTAVFGPNGSGKTSLLRAIAGLDAPETGQIRLAGLSVDEPSATHHLVGMAFQNSVFLRGTVRHNLDLALALRHVPGPERRARIEEATDECGVGHLLDRSARVLSGGEAQRVNLARALALRSPVTLLDEPLSGIDRVARTQLLAELPALLSRFTATTILVTHDREEAFRLADRLVVIIGGEVKAAGPKRLVYAQPPDRATAELLGYTVLALDGTLLAIPPGGLRPGLGEHTYTVAVEQVIDMGSHLHVAGTIGGRRVDVRLPPGAAPPETGAELRVHAGSEAITVPS